MESESVLTKQQRIAENARRLPQAGFTSLAYHMDVAWLREAWRRTRKDGAVGVDNQRAEQYAENLEENLQSLLERAKSGSYKAPPVRRVHIPKNSRGTETRPIGIPTFEDKVLQRAVQMVLEPIYEQDFLDCSWGFRPGRSAHGAVQALWKQLMDMGGGWVIDLDISKLFDNLDHTHLRETLKQRMRDGVLARLIGKWLKAGVMERGNLSYPERGSPQGGVISPILSNVYLHEVLDRWFEDVVRKHLYGRGFLVRYADDAVLVLSDERDAQRVMKALPKRFGKYSLTVHPQKTRVVCFRPPVQGSSDHRKPRGGTFNFLGFTHYWGRSRKGRWVVQRKTESGRFTRSLTSIAEWCRRKRHLPLNEQQAALRSKLLGHYAYYGITGNGRSLANFLHEVRRTWKKWLARRGSRLRWERFRRIVDQYPLPPIRIVHSVYAAKL
jgi:RNA-directed DNA polymerase